MERVENSDGPVEPNLESGHVASPASRPLPDAEAESGPDPARPPQSMRRSAVAHQPSEPGWWFAADGMWYPPEALPVPPSGAAYTAGFVTSPHGVVGNLTPEGQAALVTDVGKSKVVAGLLGIFLGMFGVHRYYLKHNGLGTLMLMLSLTSLGLLAPVVWVWGFVEGFLILVGVIRTDGRGRPLR